ncbi:hypothetical protein LPW11_15670 [Geomonas sp. RF6]|uniref:hypothetical protein n=1 Tax=Geomonas sp. RF6 TaxID=2897342 RepID=UPI001E43A031|nr:hypothetical protein [Geomonas sp. RF6]UFS69326.1 hypothetical protein LPW11_15670 [Geomonas sp. RF6]
MKRIVATLIVAIYLLLPPLCLASVDNVSWTSSTTYSLAEYSDTEKVGDVDTDSYDGCCAEHCPSGYTVSHPHSTTATPKVAASLCPQSPFKDIFIPPRFSA